MDNLPQELSQLIDGLCQKGDRFAGIEQYDDAIEQYGHAWDLLPSPKEQWPAATWILMSAGDSHFRMKEYQAAAELLFDAIECPDGEESPFLLLRLGQCLLELGQLNEAANALEEAYRMGGEPLFEDEDPKYLGFVKTQLNVAPVRHNRGGRFNHPLG